MGRGPAGNHNSKLENGNIMENRRCGNEPYLLLAKSVTIIGAGGSLLSKAFKNCTDRYS